MSDTTQPGVPVGGGHHRDSSVVPLLKRIHPRQVIWVLLLGLIGVVGVQGKQYIDRLEKIEKADVGQDTRFQEYQKTQNGHLHSIDVRLERMEGEQRVVRERLESEQRYMRAALERIERKLP